MAELKGYALMQRESIRCIVRIAASSWFLCACSCFAFSFQANVNSEGVDTPKVDRFPPVSLREAQDAIEVQPGFSIELVASEPLISSPVAMAFDAHGDLWVVEMVDYSEQETESLGRVSRLRDTDADGQMDQAQVIADRLSWPTALACLRNATWVVAPPNLIDIRPSEETGNLWTPRTILEGFGRQNVQGLANSFRWGLDGRLHVSTSSNGGSLRATQDSFLQSTPEPLSVAGRDVLFDISTGNVATCAGYGQHGMDFSPWGDRFVTSNSDHLQQVVAWYLPELTDASLSSNVAWRRSIASDGPQAEVYRISPVESWRTIRTQLRLSGASIGLLEGGGRASGYFTSATGVTIYDGDQWPASTDMMAFIADVGSNLVHRKRLRADGVAMIGERMDQETEFVRSRDTWFRPVQFANGPDGCLYIVDMARETIEHPKSLPEPIKSQLDLTSGRDRGRIWRLRATDLRIRRIPPMLDQLTPADWVEFLAHPNGWHRETVSQLLIEAQDPQCIAPLRQMLTSHASDYARLHALSVLASIPGGLDTATWFVALADRHPKVRLWALVFATRIMSQATAADLAHGIWMLQDETDLEVRMVAAVRSRDFEFGHGLHADLLLKWIGDDWDCAELRAAIEQACSGPSAVFLWMQLTNRLKDSERNEAFDPWVDMLLYQMHGSNTLPALVASWEEEPLSRIWSDRVIESLGRLTERRLISNPESLAAIADFARSGPTRRLEQCIANPDANPSQSPTQIPPRSTLQGIVRVMSSLSVEERERWLERILMPHVPLEIQMDAIEAWIGRDRELQGFVASRLQQLPPPVTHSAMKTLIRSESGATELLDLLDSHQLESAKVPAWVWQTLRAVSNESIRKRVAQWDRIDTVPWESIADTYRIPWREPGSAEQGAVHFQKWCASCHRVNGIGIALGPALDSYRVRPNEAIALAIAEPSREMDPKYEQHQVRTTDGEIVVGLLLSASADRINILTAQNETKNLARADIDEWNSTGRSMMPDGLLKELDPTALNDLIAFLRQTP